MFFFLEASHWCIAPSVRVFEACRPPQLFFVFHRTDNHILVFFIALAFSIYDNNKFHTGALSV